MEESGGCVRHRAAGTVPLTNELYKNQRNISLKNGKIR